MDMSLICANHVVLGREDYAFSLVFGIIVLAGGAKRLMKPEDPTWTRGELVTYHTLKMATIRGCIDIFVGVAAMIFGMVNLI